MIELLTTLAITSLILSLFLLNTSSFSLQSAKIIKTIQAQDDAISALLLLKHQVEAASITECAKSLDNPPYQILTTNDAPIYDWNKGRGEMVGQHALQIQQLTDIFYLRNVQEHIPVRYFENKKLVLDDCIHSKMIDSNNLNQALLDFKLPVSISVLDNQIYYLGKTEDQTSPTALFRYTNAREEVIPNLDQLDFSEQNGHIHIEVQPQFSNELYHVTI